MNQELTKDPQRQPLVQRMADTYGIEPEKFVNTVKATVMPQNATNEQLAAFLMVANEYSLNIFTRELFAFPSKGGIVPVVSVDGWIRLINEKPDFDGFEFDDHLDELGNLTAITCRIFRRGRSRPTAITEYMKECVRNTDPWKSHPARMLRHKSIIQCGRVAYGFAGIYDPDEAERFGESNAPIPTLVTRTHEKQAALREKLQPKQLAEVPAIDVLPMATEEPAKVEVKPKDTKKAKAKAEKPAGAMDVEAETAKQRELVFAMYNEMPATDRDIWLREHDMQSVNEVNKWDLDLCLSALER